MPELDWSTFNNLPGAQSQNFEHLCRGLMRLHCGKYGKFRAWKNQPGVEFDLQLTRDCTTLGAPPRWWGWQCKVFERTESGNLRSASRNKIEKSLRKTEEFFPELTDWILWTPYTLSKIDQVWYNELEAKMELHLWTDDEIDTYLSGPGLILRGTYFGDLIATPQELEQRHRESVQPIKERWFEPVHQQTDAERTLRRMLGEPGSWNHLIDTGENLQAAGEKIAKYGTTANSISNERIDKFASACQTFAEILLQFHGTLTEGDLDIIQQNLRERRMLLDDEIKATPRFLRRIAAPIALDATNALYDMRIAQDLLDEVDDFLGVGIVAILADAGGGKTQMAAAVSAPHEAKPSGILFHGRRLHHGKDLNDLARGYTLNGKPLEGFEQLLGALDAAAKRSRCRLPVIIDGLNEAENPKEWKPLLASLSATVNSYPNVLVACTLRTGERSRQKQIGALAPTIAFARESFAEWALPEGIRRIESDGFGANTEEAIGKYFDYFRIDPGDAELPFEFLQHPLTLRIFCEVTNSKREDMVNVDYFPAALAPLFEKFVEHAALRIAQLENLSHSYTSDEVIAAIYDLGIMLWENKSRYVEEKQFRSALGDDLRQWESSIVNLFAQEGIIFRDPVENPHEYIITPTFDALGGYLVASSLLSKNAQDNSYNWLNDSKFTDSFKSDDNHELASDIFRALVALTPRRRMGVQLWKIVPDIFRNTALSFTTELDPEYLDEETIEELKQLLITYPDKRTWFYNRLAATRAAPGHPLNASFLDHILQPMPSAGLRDLSWTEWTRKTRNDRLNDTFRLEEKWRSNVTSRGKGDQLRLKWLKWHLTSTDRWLRDVATRAIYWYGRGAPSALFEETIESLNINDPYVPERMMAASYGVAMAHRSEFERESFLSQELTVFARKVYDTIFSEGAPHSTTHILFRDYAARIIELANQHANQLFSPGELERSTAPFAMSDLTHWGMIEEPKYGEEENPATSPFKMDFENYTLGRLVPDRAKYDFEHMGYRETKARILWRIEQLGWFTGSFEEIDRSIASRQWATRHVNSSKKTDRYGKKYSWIAYFEMSGLLHDLGIIDQTYDGERTSDVDIDPSFPKRVLKLKHFDSDILGPANMDMADWIANGNQPNVESYIKIPQVGDFQGPWIALDGSVFQEDEIRGRRSFFFIRSFIIENSVSEDFFENLADQELGGRWLPEKPIIYYTFGGEIPWCKTYPRNDQTEFSFVENERTTKVQNTKKELLLDGKPLTDSQIEFLIRSVDDQDSTEKDTKFTDAEIERIEVREISFETDEIQRDYVEFQAHIPVCDFGWEGYQTAVSDAGHPVTLAKEIAKDLDLINLPQNFDLFTKEQEQATLTISDHSEEFHNRQSFFFIREDLLGEYLKRCDSSLIWAIWGEREYSSKRLQEFLDGPDRPEPFYGDIRDVRRFDV